MLEISAVSLPPRRQNSGPRPSLEVLHQRARSIAVDGMSDDEAAKKFIDAHPQLVAKWLAGTGAQNAA